MRSLLDIRRAAFDALCALGEPRGYAAGAPVHHRGDEATHLNLIVSGAVHFGRTSPEGRPLADGVHVAGEWFGDIALFARAPLPHDAAALERSEIIRLPRTTVEAACAESSDVRTALLGFLAERLIYAFEMLDDLRAGSIDDQLLSRLRFMAAQASGDAVRITQGDLAAYAGVSRVTAGKALKRLEAAGAVTLGYGVIGLRG